MKFLTRMFSFATDEDGLSLKDIVTIVVLMIWSVVIITGLVNDYTGVKLEQFSRILDSSTELTVYVIVATLGLVATDNIASILSNTLKSKPLSSKKKAVDNGSETIGNDQDSVIEEKKVEARSEDII